MNDSDPIKSDKHEEDASGASITPEVEQMVEEAQLLLVFAAYHPSFHMDEKTVAIFVNSKHLIRNNKWSLEAEIELMTAYDKMAAVIEPVTIQSLKDSMPSIGHSDPADTNPEKTRAGRAVAKYMLFAGFSLVLLLLAQIYWIIGSDLNKNLQSIFKKRTEIRLQVKEIKNLMASLADTPMESTELRALDDSPVNTAMGYKLKKMEEQANILNQKLDANYELLLLWNKTWQVAMGVDAYKYEVTPYMEAKYNIETEYYQQLENLFQRSDPILADARQSTIGLTEKQAALRAEHRLDKARYRMFMNIKSASFVLDALNAYILPLLYGLLGAATFVLRTLAREVRALTYSEDSEVGYRLRISLGALAGLTIGWFLSPETLAESGLSSMAAAFLVGYNVEVFFAVMDKFIRNIDKWGKPVETPQPPAGKA